VGVAYPAFADQYICIPDGVAGFLFDKTDKVWREASFKKDFKYIISPATDGKSAYSLRIMGEGPGADFGVDGYCKAGFNEGGILFCVLADMDLKFNKNLFNSVHSQVDVAPASSPIRATCGACDLTNAVIVSGSEVTTPSRSIFPVRSTMQIAVSFSDTSSPT
jgi:hypothetical protein